MSNDRQHYEQLQEELKLVEKAMAPTAAAKTLRDFIDQHSVRSRVLRAVARLCSHTPALVQDEDQLAGTAGGANPWLQVAPSTGGCCCVT